MHPIYSLCIPGSIYFPFWGTVSPSKDIYDFLTFLLQHNYAERTAKKNSALIQFIFEHLIDGTLNEQKDITMYIPKDQQKEIPIYIASSMVNEIVPIIKALTDSSDIDYIFYYEI